MPEQTPTCPGCGKSLAHGKYDVCFSEETCSKYPLHDRACFRYLLQATLPNATGNGTCLFLMLNPSTASEKCSDPTVDQCIELVKEWNTQGCSYGKLVICNLFAFRSPKQRDLKDAGYPKGPDNNQHIRQVTKCAAKVILAWGSNVQRGRVSEVLQMLRDEDAASNVLTSPKCESPLTVNGEPRHPLPRDNSLPVETTQCVPVVLKQTARGNWRLSLR